MKKTRRKVLKKCYRWHCNSCFLAYFMHYNSVAETLKTYAKSYFLESS